ncbi:MAG: hypothetical protein BWY96_01276 [Spirochaetes bacterium ADurb.BinA120]|nr:MAG: hypothetical protein BWY96_01276 [Spirochaetes bacterium ADurb.BinA120]
MPHPAQKSRPVDEPHEITGPSGKPPRSRRSSHASGAPMADCNSAVLNDYRHLPASAGKLEHFFQPGGIFFNVEIISSVPIGRPGLFRIGSTGFAKNNHPRHYIPPLLIAVLPLNFYSFPGEKSSMSSGSTSPALMALKICLSSMMRRLYSVPPAGRCPAEAYSRRLS